MNRVIHRVELQSERDVVAARQKARSIAEAFGFDHHEQIRIATAVSEIARNAFRYAKDGAVAFSLDADDKLFHIAVTDHGPGIPHLDTVMRGAYRSTTGMGMGIIGTRRLMDRFHIESTPLGTAVEFGKLLPPHSSALHALGFERIAADLARQHPATPLEELQVQNRELLRTLDELRERKDELARINAELEDTNRGVVALYAELDERADYLRRASDLKSSFLSNMSHEFRTPLNSMLALTRMLLDRMDGDLSEEQDQQIRFIQRSAKELADMVDDLLDLAKVEAGRLEVRTRAFEVSDLFGALRGMLKPLLAESAIHLVFEIEGTLPTLHTDEQKVSQVLRNFISNAIKFTPRGEVRVSACAAGNTIRFAVADTGIGISESDQQIIFEEFAQIESTEQKKVKGTGLGLPLTRKLAELLGGTVEAESTVGKGSTFRLTIPALYNGTVETAPDLPSVADATQLILIVEDNQETAFLYDRYLVKAGFQTYTVTNIQATESFLERVVPAAILLDINLGHETSWDFLRRVKAHGPSVPVAVVSITQDSHRVFGTGADAFLVKPFVPDQLIETVLRLTVRPDRRRVLLIDDNEVARYLLRGHIPEQNYEVFEARDGREGLRMAQQLCPAVIFVDFYMPDLNGAEVLRNLAQTDNCAHTRIILHSTRTFDAKETAEMEKNGIFLLPKQALTLPDASAQVLSLLEGAESPAKAGTSHG